MTDQTESFSPFLLTCKQVAQRLAVSKSYAYALMQCGEIAVVRIGKAVRVRPKDLEDFIKANLDLGQNGQKAKK